MDKEVASEWIKTTCPYCGVGCGVEAKVSKSDNSPPQVEIRGDASHPSNFGRLCSKGLALGETLSPNERMHHPSIGGKKTSWELALSTVAHKFRQCIDRHGPDSVALYVSGQLLTEDYYVANKLMKGFIGSANIDTNSRLCMSSSVAGHQRAFGSDTVPGCYQDLEIADTVVLVGSNLAWCHPVLFQRLKAAKDANPDMKVIVIDPRETDSCAIADLFLPINAGTDVALFNGLLAYLERTGLFDQAFIASSVNGVEEAFKAAAQFTSEQQLADFLGLSLDSLDQFYQLWSASKKVVTVYSQGVNQSSQGVDKVNSIINCHLATGRIGAPGMGPFSVTGQPNAMGGREVGGLANMLAAHMDFDDVSLDRVQRFWDAPNMATQPGSKAIEMFDKIHRGEIKAVWIMATNPAVSLPDSNRVREALTRCEFVAVSDCVDGTDTLAFADVCLPAQGWSEKSGTVTNSERRISRQRRLVDPVGSAKPDWWIICEVAKRMGYGHAFDYANEAEIFREHAAMSGFENDGNRDFDIHPYADPDAYSYDAMRPFQWPAQDLRDLSPNRRLFSNHTFFTPDGKARMVAVSASLPKVLPDSKYPLVFNSGRVRDQWHTMTRTGLSAKLTAHIAEPFVATHPDDAKRFGLTDGGLADVRSRVGHTRLRVQISRKVKPGEIFAPIHWSQANSALGTVSALVTPDVDPISGQPESKFTPVSMTSWIAASEAVLLSRTQLNLSGQDYWVEQKIEGAYLYRLASCLDASQLLNKLSQHEVVSAAAGQLKLVFEDPSAQSYRRAFYDQGRIKLALIVAPALDATQTEWMTMLTQQLAGIDSQHSLLSGQAKGQLAQGRQICACKQVGRITLCNAIAEGADSLDALSAKTGAGTGCGSCVPEIEQLLNDVNEVADELAMQIA